jgi:hypothetical protein
MILSPTVRLFDEVLTFLERGLRVFNISLIVLHSERGICSEVPTHSLPHHIVVLFNHFLKLSVLC